MRRALSLLTLVPLLGGCSGMQTNPSVQTPAGPTFASVIVEESHDIPNVSVSIAVLSGAAADPVGKEGLAKLTAEMVLRGSRTRPNAKLQDELDSLGSSLTTTVTHDWGMVSGEALTRNLDVFLTIMADVVTNPAFDPAEFEKLKSLTISRLRQADEDDEGLGRKRAREFALAGHPYGHVSQGTPRSIAAIALDDVRSFYAKHYVAGNLVIGAAGDVDRRSLSGVLARHFAAVRAGARVTVAVPSAPAPTGRRFLLVDKPARNQTQIYLMHAGIVSSHADFFPFLLANEVFGGSGFGTILMKEVRVKRGFAYGAFSFLVRKRAPDLYGIYVFPAAKDALATLELVFSLYEAAAKEGLPASDFEDAKASMVRKFPFLVDTAEKRLSQRLETYTLGLPADFLDTYRAKLEKVTKEQVDAAARAHFHPDRLQIAMVCTASELREGVAKLPGVASVETVAWDADHGAK